MNRLDLTEFNVADKGGTRRPVRILVAEDNAINRLVAVRTLTLAGHAVETAIDGQAALEMLQRKSFDLVLMDVQMPIMGGFEATARIREWESERRDGRRLPIIALTASSMKGDRERCLEAGMDGYLSKPMQTTQLLEAVDHWVGSSVVASVAESPVASPSPNGQSNGLEATSHSDLGTNCDSTTLPDKVTQLRPSSDSPSDKYSVEENRPAREKEVPTQWMETDPLYQREIAEMFLEDCPVSLQAIAMAITNRDGPKLRAAAQSLKGSAGAFRDRAAVAAAARLEIIGRQEDWNQVESAWNGLQQEMARLSAELNHFLEVTQSTNIIDQGGTGA